MKKYLLLFCFCLVVGTAKVISANITAYLNYGLFYAPTNGPYIETYLSVIGNSLEFVKNQNGMLQGTVDISMSFIQNGEIVTAKKYSLNSPEIWDTAAVNPNFIDQQRYSLAPGSYEMEISIADKNRPDGKLFHTKVPLEIKLSNETIAWSSIQLLESYAKSTETSVITKNGYDLVPYVSNYFPDNSNRIKFYAELYNAKKIVGEGEKLIVNYYIESYEHKRRLGNFAGFDKQIAKDVNVLLAEFDIKNLPTGNYNLVIEARNKENKIQTQQKCFIQRTNNTSAAMSIDEVQGVEVSHTFVSTYKSIDSLRYFVKCLRPISSASEVQFSENQLMGKNLELLQQYFYNFWKSRNSLTPEIAWLDYYEEVLTVNKEFDTYGLRGFETDRGRVYLQYGPPNTLTKYYNEPGASPFEIWEYNALEDKKEQMTNPDRHQSNKKFVFYNSDLVSNKFLLIHSDARGEPSNIYWKSQVYRGNSKTGRQAPGNFGSNIDDNYISPR